MIWSGEVQHVGTTGYCGTMFLSKRVFCASHFQRNIKGEFIQILVPKELRSEILAQLHDNVLSGHLGVRKTMEKLSQRYYWYNLKQDVKWFIGKCDVCAADKLPVNTPKAPMEHITSGALWETLALDYLSPFPITPRSNRYILVMTDTFTKYLKS